MKPNLNQGGLLLVIFGPLAVAGLGKAGVSEVCSNELVQLAPALLGALLIHFHNWKEGHTNILGAKV